MKLGNWVLPVAVLAVAGCSGEDRSEIGAHAGQAWKSASAATSKAFESASAQASKLTEESSKQALEATRAGLIKAQQELANVQTPAGLDQLKVDLLKAQIERIDAAILLQKLKAEAQVLGAKAQGVAFMTYLQLQAKRSELRDQSPEFRELDDRLTEAQRAYEDAAAKVKAATERLDGGK